MDLSWCIMCDQRIDEPLEGSLYCSEQCQARDLQHCQLDAPSTSPRDSLDQSRVYKQDQQDDAWAQDSSTNKLLQRLKTVRTKQQRQAKQQTSAYPWDLLYSRPRNKRPILVKRCQPMVASSLTTATAFFAPKSSMA
ncbi:hypothetical protein DM01DRAFT_1178275 [Hesseltinella vesiculosa]|uniref:Uncharacterized protein n=1 Tax=Hesseltinella vesiculosa TaxID=101127 RepID=A0A1X2G4F2_9FUNG|nr:hypothetical protein DM01DRAFT_1178275 [Hesseltinella vesiculosa]